MPIHVRSKRRAAPAAATPSSAPVKGALPLGLPRPAPGKAQKPAGISLCMIVKNEERFLAQALASAQDVVDEMIVVDTGSTDATVEIAKSFGATVVHAEWRNDFGWARNKGLEVATKRWILVLDADEELMPSAYATLRQLKTVPAEHTALWARLYNKSDDYQGTGAMSHALIRVFPNDPEIRYRGLIHEYATYKGDPNGLRAVTSPIGIVHHGYVKEVVESRDKGARNLAIVRAATEAEPEEAYHWFNLGATAFLVGDYATTRDALERMRAMVGTQHRGFVPNGLAVLAETYCDKLGDPVKGEEAARAGLEFSPNYANAHFQLGKALVAQQRFDEGRQAFFDAIADGKYAAQQYVIDDQVYIWKAHSEIGSSYVMQKDDVKALEWFEKGLVNAPKAEPLHINRAKSLERLGRIDEALAAYRAVFDMHGTDQSAIEYVNALLRQRREADALAAIEASYARFAPEKAVPLLMAAAAIAQRQGTLDDERYLRAAADKLPGSSEVLDPLEALLRERGKTGDIAPLIAREEEVPPRSASDYLRRARRAIVEGRYADARALAESGVELAPADGKLAYAYAVALAQMGDEDAALAALDRLENPGEDVALTIWMFKASLLRNRGRLDESAALVERILAADPKHLEALMLRAALMEAAGSMQECEDALKRAFAIDRQRAALDLSSFYLRGGRFEEAATIADQALQA